VNKLKKITNEVTSYQVEHEKLSRILEQIKKEQEKYGIEASHAHSKYYQTLEELKIKNTQIQNLQRENQEVENKCKHQQNLYEAVRSDRNLYSKDFIKSKDEINELKKKYKRMTYAVDQLREEIKNKDQKLVELDKDYKKVEAENVKIKADKNRAKAQIQSNEEVIKNQENHINHMKKIIQSAKQQKAKQQKDYDMVRNERDILGTQLIKRNHELSVLYEKIKLSNSNLIKGNIYCQQKSR
jgi:chromosome segregation ATPase